MTSLGMTLRTGDVILDEKNVTSMADAIADGRICDLCYCWGHADGPPDPLTDDQIGVVLMSNAIDTALAHGVFEMSPGL